MAERCQVTAGCEGHIVDGFCDVCGMQPAGPPPPEPASAASAAAGSQRTGSQRNGSTQLSGKTATGSRRSGSTRSSSRRRLGLGLVSVPELPKADPLDNLMPEAKVPEGKRYCTGTRPDGSACESPLTREKCTRCGQAHDYIGTPRKACSKCGGPCELVAREKGFCNVCGTPYDFRPKLAPGDVVSGQYEVAGCIAFGGMGWVYLAKDLTLGRFVLLKGLVNSSDPSLARAAVAERQFLAEVKHPNIVGVYTCVSDTRTIDARPETHAYTVMEFVGGKTLKALRKERGPLPVAEALAYMHPVLSAFGYMHGNQLLYNDFKPDNVMLEQGDIKVIDLGGVCRMTQTDTDLYSTAGYAAPELATGGPSITSDLYSVGRTLAVLTTEFRGFQSSHKHALRAPADEPVYRQHDSFYKLLLKACHDNPNMRFQDAEEMAEQLVGVLREVVAREAGQVRPADSALFGPDPLGFRAGGDVHRLDADALPELKLDPADPATAFIVGNAVAADPRRQTPVLARAIERFPDSLAARLAMARHQLRLGDCGAAEQQLALVEARDAFEWRVIWLRGLALILQGDHPAAYEAAIEAFETCYREVPGELAPKLAIAVASELAGHRDQAMFYYDTVSRTDPGYATAAFGLARCLAAAGKRAEAVAALGRIAQTSSLYADAQKAIAATLIDARPSRPGLAELEQASSTIDALMLEGVERFRSMRDVLSVALDLVRGGHLPPAETRLLGHRVDEAELRRGLEHAYRNLARLTDDAGQRIALVDLANQVRPRTWL